MQEKIIDFHTHAFGDELALKAMKALTEGHPADYILFGTDSPWRSQKETFNLLENLNLDTEKLNKILYKNAQKLLATN